MTSRIINQIRRLYENTTPTSVEHDLKQAVRLLKTLPNEEGRSRAAVFMDGLSQLRSEWRVEKHRKQNRASKARRLKKPERET